MTSWQSASVAFLATAEGTEQAELTEPWQAVLAKGGKPVLVSPAPAEIQMFEHLDRGDTRPVDVPLRAADHRDYVGLVLPGGGGGGRCRAHAARQRGEPWLLLDPRRLAGAVWLIAATAGRVAASNVRLARRIWDPRRPLSSGMLVVPTQERGAGVLTAVGLMTSVVVDNQLVDLDPSRGQLQYHAVAVPDGGPGAAGRATNVPAERLLRLLRPAEPRRDEARPEEPRPEEPRWAKARRAKARRAKARRANGQREKPRRDGERQ